VGFFLAIGLSKSNPKTRHNTCTGIYLCASMSYWLFNGGHQVSTFSKVKFGCLALCAAVILVKVTLFPASVFAAFAALATLITIAAE
jgi:hypothetical protein